MPPYSDPSINDVEEHFYRLNEDYEMTTGKAAPWRTYYEYRKSRL